MNELMSDALDDLRDEPLFGCPFPAPALPGRPDTDPQFVAVVDTCTMMIDAMAMQAMMVGFQQGMRTASERRPYVAVPGARQALGRTLHQMGVK